MLAARLSRVAQTGLEILVSLVLSILFFGIFLFILNDMFPIGGGLKHGQSESNGSGSFGVMERTVSDLLMMRGDQEIEPEGNVAAVLFRRLKPAERTFRHQNLRRHFMGTDQAKALLLEHAGNA